MDLTPETLRSVQFRTEMRGYNRIDVDRFLEDVARVLAEMQQHMESLARKASRAEEEASGSKELEETMRKTLLIAQQTADQVVKEARAEAATISSEAAERATRINALAEDKARATIVEAEQRAEAAYREARLRLAAEVEQLDAERRGLVLDLERVSAHVVAEREKLRETVEGLVALVGQGEFLRVEKPDVLTPDQPPASQAADPEVDSSADGSDGESPEPVEPDGADEAEPALPIGD